MKGENKQMFVSVSYYDEKLQGFKVGRAYTYTTSLYLKCGDVVSAPVKNRGTGVTDDKRAMVVATDLETPNFQCNEITSYWTEDNDDGK